MFVTSDGLPDGGALLDHNASYALADSARFARASWDCGSWGRNNVKWRLAVHFHWPTYVCMFV